MLLLMFFFVVFRKYMWSFDHIDDYVVIGLDFSVIFVVDLLT